MIENNGFLFFSGALLFDYNGVLAKAFGIVGIVVVSFSVVPALFFSLPDYVGIFVEFVCALYFKRFTLFAGTVVQHHKQLSIQVENEKILELTNPTKW